MVAAEVRKLVERSRQIIRFFSIDGERDKAALAAVKRKLLADVASTPEPEQNVESGGAIRLLLPEERIVDDSDDDFMEF